MHIADFLGYAAVHRGLTDQLAAVAPFPDAPDARCLLLSGPERCGKTTLLFHAALSLARQGASVLLLCRREKLEACPPLLPEGVQNSDPAWERVHIKYVANGYELLRYVSHIHALPSGPPDVLLVDDLHALADLPAGDRHRPRDMALCRILAALHEAAVEVGRLNGRPCHLVATETSHAEGPRLLYIIQRWLPLVLHIRRELGVKRLSVGQGYVLAPLNPRPTLPLDCQAQLHFSLRHGVLALDGILHAPMPPAPMPRQQQQQQQHAAMAGDGGW